MSEFEFDQPETGYGEVTTCEKIEIETMETEKPAASSREGGHASEEEGSEDEGLALLPRHTKVLVTGNNRTKTSLVGLYGVVKKAVGLGGWHWLILSNGAEVRLQRNALSVIEHPSPEELEADEEDIPVPVQRPGSDKEKLVAYHKLRPKRPRHQAETSDGPNSGIGKAVAMRRSNDRKREAGSTNINFNKLEAGSLRKYRRHYKLEIGPNASKDQLVSAVQQHFSMHTVDESNVIAAFLLAYSHSNSKGR